MINILRQDTTKAASRTGKLTATISLALWLTLSLVGNKAGAQVSPNKISTPTKEVKTPFVQKPEIPLNTYTFGGMERFRTLDAQVLIGGEEKAFFKQWLNECSFIQPTFVERAAFNALQGNFLQEVGGGDTLSYTLFLPNDLGIGELPGIIKRVNMITFGDELPVTSSHEEIKGNVESAIKYLLSLKTGHNKDQIHKAVKKYYILYQQYFPGENPRIDTSKTSNPEMGEIAFTKILQKINKESASYEINPILGSVDNALANSFYAHFFETFFEQGKEVLGNVDKLKEDIGLAKIKTDLANARKSGNKQQLVLQEKKALNTILYGIYHHGFKSKGINKEILNTSVPAEIVRTNETTCVGFSIIAHALLQDLGIKYNVVGTYNVGIGDEHSFVSVTLSNGESYMFDALRYDKIIKYTVTDRIGGATNFTYTDPDGSIYTSSMVMGDDADKTIIGQILNNQAVTIDCKNDTPALMKQKLAMYERSLSFFNKSPNLWYNVAYLNYKIKNYEKALQAINNVILITPNDVMAWQMKVTICASMDDTKLWSEALDMVKLLKQK